MDRVRLFPGRRTWSDQFWLDIGQTFEIQEAIFDLLSGADGP
jgi:hypothetical protein